MGGALRAGPIGPARFRLATNAGFVPVCRSHRRSSERTAYASDLPITCVPNQGPTEHAHDRAMGIDALCFSSLCHAAILSDD
jgi:hypothetical protein